MLDHPLETQHEMQRLAHFGVVSDRPRGPAVELQRELGCDRLEEPCFEQLHEQAPRRGAVEQRGAEFGGQRLGRYLRQQVEIGSQAANRAVELEGPLVCASVVAQPSDGVLADAVEWVAARHDLACSPVVETLERIEQLVLTQPPRDRADGHVTGSEVGLDAFCQRTAVTAAEARDLDAAAFDRQRERAPLLIGVRGLAPDVIVLQ